MRDGLRVSGWVIGGAAVVIIVSLVIGAMALFGFGLFNRATADFRGTNEQIEKTRADGDYRIAAYDHFYDLCASVQTAENEIKNSEDELDETKDATRRSQIRANITAQKNSRAEKINDYNADARKEGTQGQFRASDLPYQLNVNEEETQCSL
jgi:hypothetical protein